MKLFGSIKELVSAVFRKDTYEITLRPNQSTTYTAARDVQLPAKDGNAVLVSSGDIVNADINASAAIAYSKLALSNSIVNADVAAGAAVAYSKLNLSGSIVNADISNTAAIDAAKIGTGVVSNTEFGYLDGVTSAIQTQLNGKQATITGAATTITSSDLSASKALQSDASGKVAASSVTSTELGYVSGVTSAIQTQLNNKAAKGANSDITSLSGLTTALSIGQGGTGQTTQQAALTALAGTQVSGQYLRSNGTNTLLSAIQAADVPTLNQNTTGTAANVTGTVAIGNGGTGQTTANAALNALLPSQASAANKYLKSDGTNTSWASASGGAGEINAILNSSGADGVTGWVNGTSHNTPTVITGANNPLNGIISTAFSFTASAGTASASSGQSGIGIYNDMVLPSGLQNRKLKIEFSYNTPASSLGTWAVVLYQGSTRIALSTDSSGDTVLPANVTGGKFTAYFDSINASAYRLLLVQRTRTSANTLYITNVIVGPGIQPQGAVIGPPTAYTPTTDGFGTIIAPVTFYTRRGSFLKVEGRFTTGTVNTNTAYVSFPAGLNVDTSAVSSNMIVGKWWRNISTAGVRKTGGLATDYTTNPNILRFVNDDYTTGSAPATPLQGSAVAGSSEVIWFDFELPIAEWAGSGTVQLAQNDVEFAFNTSTATAANDTTSFGYGPQGAAIQAITAGLSRRCRFQTPIQPTDILQVEVKPSTGSQWISVSSTPTDSGSSNSIIPQVNFNGTIYGVLLRQVNNTDVDVVFGTYPSTAGAGAYGGGAFAWSAGANPPSGWSWRVRKQSAGAAVGFGIVSPGTSAGLVSAAGLPGNTTGNAIASGYVGEVQSSSWSAQTVATTATLLATISNVTPGVYLVTLNSDVSFGSATRVVGTLGGTATRTPASPTSAPEYVRAVVTTTASASYVYPIVVTTSGTITWSATANTASTSADCRGTINLIRIA